MHETNSSFEKLVVAYMIYCRRSQLLDDNPFTQHLLPVIDDLSISKGSVGSFRSFADGFDFRFLLIEKQKSNTDFSNNKSFKFIYQRTNY